MVAGGLWIGLAGWLRHYRGVNETISSLLLSYIAIAIMNFFVEGALRDPASANKPSTMPIGDAYRIGAIPGTDVHWGFAAGIVLAVVLYILMARTTFGFAARMTGGTPANWPAAPAPSASSAPAPASASATTATGASGITRQWCGTWSGRAAHASC